MAGPELAVIGLGYVGLALAQAAAEAGVDVVGYDIDPQRAERACALDLAASADPAVLGGAAAFAICVPTPLASDGTPDLTAVEAAGTTVAAHLTAGALVVLESTTYPGTTEERLRPLLEQSGLRAGEDFWLGYSPERVDPGNPRWGVRNTPKIVGGLTPACADAAVALYERFVGTVVRARGLREAELAKLLENTYRHVNIALLNEMALFSHELGIDLWDAIDLAATKPFGYARFEPGPGVGGHCIPIDPNYLSYRVRSLGYPFRFVELAQEINDRMPAYVVARAQELLNRDGLAMRGRSVVLLGVAYKPDVDDVRGSPAAPIVRRLRALEAEVAYHDPLVPSWSVDGAPVPVFDAGDAKWSALAASDLVILLQAHGAYDLDLIAAAAPRVLDTRGRMRAANVERL